MPPRLLTAAESAERLNVSVRTVHSWISTGRLAAVRLSPRCTRVPADALEALVRRSENPQRPDLSPLLWDTDPNRIDEERDAIFLIVRILTAGRPEHVSWMFRRYPVSQIEGAILRDRRLTARVRGAWTNLLGLAGTHSASAEPSP